MNLRQTIHGKFIKLLLVYLFLSFLPHSYLINVVNAKGKLSIEDLTSSLVSTENWNKGRSNSYDEEHNISFKKKLGLPSCGDIASCDPSQGITLAKLFGNCSYLSLGAESGVKPEVSTLAFNTSKTLVVFLVSSKLYFTDSTDFYNFLERNIAQEYDFCLGEEESNFDRLNLKENNAPSAQPTIFYAVNQYCNANPGICHVELNIRGAKPNALYPANNVSYKLECNDFDNQ